MRRFTHVLFLSLIMFLMLTGNKISAQDIHYSQAQNSPLNISPSLIGISNADMRFSANYRHQWYTVPVDYTTFTGSFDKKFYNANNNKTFWSGGVLFNYDQAGDSRLTHIQLGVGASFTYLLNENNLITLGLQLGGSNRNFSQDQLEWDNQFNGVMYDPNLLDGENFDETSIFMFNTGTGLNYRWQKNKRSHIDLGVGLHHFLRPNNDFYEDGDTKVPMRISPYIQTSFKLFSAMDFCANGLLQIQGEAIEVVPSAYLRFYINNKPGRKFMFDIGAITRWSEEWDAIAPAAGLWINNWHAELSYDINMSDFTDATGRVGGPELTIQYFITTVKPLNSFKTCPIF